MHGSSLKKKIQNNSKVIVFTRNHTDDDADNGTKNNMSHFDVYAIWSLLYSAAILNVYEDMIEDIFLGSDVTFCTSSDISWLRLKNNISGNKHLSIY